MRREQLWCQTGIVSPIGREEWAGVLRHAFRGPSGQGTFVVFALSSLSIHSMLGVAGKTLTRWPVVSIVFFFDPFLYLFMFSPFKEHGSKLFNITCLDNADAVGNHRPPSGFCVISVERWDRSEIRPGPENTDFSMRVTEGSCSFSLTESWSLHHAYTLISSHLREVMLWLLLCQDLEYICAPKPKGACGSSKGCIRQHDFHVMFCAACFKCGILLWFDLLSILPQSWDCKKPRWSQRSQGVQESRPRVTYRPVWEDLFFSSSFKSVTAKIIGSTSYSRSSTDLLGCP